LGNAECVHSNIRLGPRARARLAKSSVAQWATADFNLDQPAKDSAQPQGDRLFFKSMMFAGFP